MKTIKQTYHIRAPIEEVWQALVNPKHIEAWGGGPAKMDDKPGTRFKLWGGDIHGTNKEVKPRKRLVQEWYSGDWPEPSIVTFELFVENGRTRIDFLHENVPNSEAKDIEKGWKDYYLGPLKEYLENKLRREK